MHHSEHRDETQRPPRQGSGGMKDRRGVAVWGAGGLFAALLLLGAFYLVLEQAMQRARQHWAPQQQAGMAGCDPAQARGPGGACEAPMPPR